MSARLARTILLMAATGLLGGCYYAPYPGYAYGYPAYGYPAYYAPGPFVGGVVVGGSRFYR